MNITRWVPGLITWLYDHSNNPRMKKLRWNRSEGRRIARTLLDSKRQELKDGALRKDVMSFLGLLLPFFSSLGVMVERRPLVKSSDSQRQDWRLTDEEIISQVR